MLFAATPPGPLSVKKNPSGPLSLFVAMNTSTYWSLNKMQEEEEDDEEDDDDHDHHIILQLQNHHQVPMASLIWPANHNNHLLHQTVPSPPIITAPPSSSSGLLGDMLGLHKKEEELEEEEEEELGAMKEMMYKMAAMQPVDIDPSTVRKPKRRNVRISDDPQSVAARHRRERISEKIRILQRLVPGGTKMDTASMLDEAIRYVKFLKRQIKLLQQPPHHSIAVATDLLRLSPAACDIIWPFPPTSTAPAPSSISMDVQLPGLGFAPGGS